MEIKLHENGIFRNEIPKTKFLEQSSLVTEDHLFHNIKILAYSSAICKCFFHPPESFFGFIETQFFLKLFGCDIPH